MGLDLLMDRGTPIERQRFTWRELVQAPISKQVELEHLAKLHRDHTRRTCNAEGRSRLPHQP